MLVTSAYVQYMLMLMRIYTIYTERKKEYCIGLIYVHQTSAYLTLTGIGSVGGLPNDST